MLVNGKNRVNNSLLKWLLEQTEVISLLQPEIFAVCIPEELKKIPDQNDNFSLKFYQLNKVKQCLNLSQLNFDR